LPEISITALKLFSSTAGWLQLKSFEKIMIRQGSEKALIRNG
jgi:hypothetical protein